MTPSNTHDPAGPGSSDDLRGLEILLVEDSWSVGEAVKDVLELLGADVVGPAASQLDGGRQLSNPVNKILRQKFYAARRVASLNSGAADALKPPAALKAI